MTKYDFRRIGDLQDYGEPYVSLYMDMSDRTLYLSIKVSEDISNNQYVIVGVRAEQVQLYMQEKLSLTDIIFQASHVLLRKKTSDSWMISRITRQQALQYVGEGYAYIPTFCYDKYKIQRYIGAE